MLSVSSRIITRLAVSISYDDNHYTTVTSKTPQVKHYEFNRTVLYTHMQLHAEHNDTIKTSDTVL